MARGSEDLYFNNRSSHGRGYYEVRRERRVVFGPETGPRTTYNNGSQRGRCSFIAGHSPVSIS